MGPGTAFENTNGGNMKKKRKNSDHSTILGHECNVEGTIEFKGTMYLDGHVKGRIYGNEGTLIIGEKAVVNADIVVNNAMISGEVNGTVEANERIDVFPPGQVIGDIQAPVISIETGAVFNGSCGMKSSSVMPEKIVKTEMAE